MYSTHIPNRKFDLIKISVLRDRKKTDKNQPYEDVKNI